MERKLFIKNMIYEYCIKLLEKTIYQLDILLIFNKLRSVFYLKKYNVHFKNTFLDYRRKRLCVLTNTLRPFTY